MNVKRIPLLIFLVVACAGFWSCASRQVISEEIKAEAERVSFKTLAQQMDRYKGKTVILGGYIIETKNIGGIANMTVLQTPLGRDEMPVFRGRSEGGFILSYNGYLEPEVYEKGRRATVAGKVIGRIDQGAVNCPKPCLKLEYRQIYLWPMFDSPSYLSYDEESNRPFGWYEQRPYGY
ncbi:MAG: Slp family lipoprotein [Desulfobacteraceae bacterium]|jgi:outer membrane lipoprotein